MIDHPTFTGWAIEGSWILTGESKVYTPSAINNEVGSFGAPEKTGKPVIWELSPPVGAVHGIAASNTTVVVLEGV